MTVLGQRKPSYRTGIMIGMTVYGADFWTRVAVGAPDECWLWTAGKTTQGYGSFRRHGTHHYAHRMSYEQRVGPIPDGLTLDHLCHTRDTSCPGGDSCPHRACCNPLHLEPVTRGENRSRAGLSGVARVHAARAQCHRGHDLNPENLMSTVGRRTCKQCAKMRRDAHRDRQRAW